MIPQGCWEYREAGERADADKQEPQQASRSETQAKRENTNERQTNKTVKLRNSSPSKIGLFRHPRRPTRQGRRLGDEDGCGLKSKHGGGALNPTEAWDREPLKMTSG